MSHVMVIRHILGSLIILLQPERSVTVPAGSLVRTKPCTTQAACSKDPNPTRRWVV